ncbi:hypothetical protein [Simkania sp.]|uniref:hypothetical protein n=1 Tax=Simkania sp. TaxID=34094 RepID=UPI003B51C2CD
MDYQEAMLVAINDQSNSITSLQIGQAESTDFVAQLLDSVYKSAQDEQRGILTMISAFNAFYAVMSSGDLSDYFENYWDEHNPHTDPPKGESTLEAGALEWRTDFNNKYNPNQNGVRVDPEAYNESGKDKDKYFDDPDDWTINFSIEGKSYSINGQQFIDNYQNYLALMQTEYQQSQQDWSNQEQGDQTILQDQQSGVEGTAQSGANLISTGSSIVQAMGFTSSLLASSM